MENDTVIPDKPYWKCSECGYTLQADTPPDICASCNERCEFKDVTCYQPDCGFKGVDPRL
jgi:rubrerythrin